MAFDVTIGQYFEGDSPLHKADPRAKIIATILFIVVIFLAKNIFSFVLLTAAVIAMILVSRIPIKMILRSMRPLIIIIAFTAVMNIFWTKGEILLVDKWIFHIYLEGIINSLLMIVRIVALLAGTCVLLTYTTTPISLTDGLEQLLAPLAKLKLPVHEFSMMTTIALRFIPTLVEETQKIMNAQKARGADFTTGSLAKRAKALIPILIPLFIGAFRRADELATAMECRCYRGGEGRTRMNILHAKPSDVVLNLLIILLGAAIILINLYVPGYIISIY